MTSKERDAIDALRSEVHQYHVDVCAHIAECKPLFTSVDKMKLDLYGNPADREGTPGLLSSNQELRKSRKIIIGLAAGAWTLCTILFSYAVGLVWK